MMIGESTEVVDYFENNKKKPGHASGLNIDMEEYLIF